MERMGSAPSGILHDSVTVCCFSFFVAGFLFCLLSCRRRPIRLSLCKLLYGLSKGLDTF